MVDRNDLMAAAMSFGKINQSLYFSRLHCDNARHIEQDTVGEPHFIRQQQLCCLEAAVDCLFRAVFFLSVYLVNDSTWRKQLVQSPDQILPLLKKSLVAFPNPEVSSLIRSLENPHALALLLEARSAIWSYQSNSGGSASNAMAMSEIKLLDVSLSIDSCEQWMHTIAELAIQLQSSGVEL